MVHTVSETPLEHFGRLAGIEKPTWASLLEARGYGGTRGQIAQALGLCPNAHWDQLAASVFKSE
jgi:hypothetical protein